MTEKIVTATITILGKNYPIRCQESELPLLEKAAEYLNSKMASVQDSGKVINLERIAIITALNVANELLQQEEYKTNLLNKINHRMTRLQEKLDLAVSKGRQTDLLHIAD